MKTKIRGILITIIMLWTLIFAGCSSTDTDTDYLMPEKTEATSELSTQTDEFSSEENGLSSSESASSGDTIDVSVQAGQNTFASGSAKSGNMTVHFLDVGQGLSILVQSQGQTMIYDGGDRSSSSSVVSYLKAQGVTTIDYLISSHYDEDHVSGLIGCLNAFTVNNVICADYVHESNLYESFISTVASKGLDAQHPSVGTTFSFGSGGFTILSPSESNPNDSNANSVVIKLTNGENSFIFTGDAEYKNETDMIASGLDLSCDVLCLGHHGSASSTSAAFLMATVPEYAVISCGEGNSYGHPHEEVLEYLESMELSLFRTDKQGTIIASSNGTEITWNTDPCNDYSSGDSEYSGTTSKSDTQQSLSIDAGGNKAATSSGTSESNTQTSMVWLSSSGTKYHRISNCGGMNPDKARQISLSEAIASGYEACSRCF